jgi:hypothetical protein
VEYDRKGIWGENMKEGKRRRKKNKRRQKKGESWKK